jgi:hypothetical protein
MVKQASAPLRSFIQRTQSRLPSSRQRPRSLPDPKVAFFNVAPPPGKYFTLPESPAEVVNDRVLLIISDEIWLPLIAASAVEQENEINIAADMSLVDIAHLRFPAYCCRSLQFRALGACATSAVRPQE